MLCQVNLVQIGQSFETHLFLGSEGQRTRSRVTKTLPARAFALFWVLASSCNKFRLSFYVRVQKHWLGCTLMAACKVAFSLRQYVAVDGDISPQWEGYLNVYHWVPNSLGIAPLSFFPPVKFRWEDSVDGFVAGQPSAVLSVACVAGLVGRLLRIHRTVNRMMRLLEYFTCREWRWTTNNIRQLLSNMSPADRHVPTIVSTYFVVGALWMWLLFPCALEAHLLTCSRR